MIKKGVLQCQGTHMTSNPHIEIKRLAITDSIVENGVHVVATADTGDCPCCQAEGKARKHKNRMYTELNDGYVHSVGFHGLGLPEIFVFVGPSGHGDEKIDVKELRERLQEAADFIHHIYENRDGFVFSKTQAYGGENCLRKGLFFIICFDASEDIGDEVRNKYMSHTVGYYNTTDFKTVAFKMAKVEINR